MGSGTTGQGHAALQQYARARDRRQARPPLIFAGFPPKSVPNKWKFPHHVSSAAQQNGTADDAVKKGFAKR
jgi:hypothetical protein